MSRSTGTRAAAPAGHRAGAAAAVTGALALAALSHVGCDYVRSIGFADPGARGAAGDGGLATPFDGAIPADPALPDGDEPAPAGQSWTTLRLGVRADVDVLFVVGSTPSMAAAQAKLAAAVPRLLGALGDARDRPHLHLGVVTADLGAGPLPDGRCRPGGDAAALRRAASVPGCVAPLDGARLFRVAVEHLETGRLELAQAQRDVPRFLFGGLVGVTSRKGEFVGLGVHQSSSPVSPPHGPVSF